MVSQRQVVQSKGARGCQWQCGQRTELGLESRLRALCGRAGENNGLFSCYRTWASADPRPKRQLRDALMARLIKHRRAQSRYRLVCPTTYIV